MARTTLELRRSLSLDAFYRLSYQIAIFYATTATKKTRTCIMEKFDITESAYYTLLDMAITHNLVDDITVEKINAKILANQADHGNSGHYSQKKQARLKKERKDLSAFTKKDIKEIATYFANTPEKTKLQISKEFRFHSPKVLDHILQKACKELIISDTVYKALIARSLKRPKDLEATMRYFNTMTQYRNEVKGIKKNDPPAQE